VPDRRSSEPPQPQLKTAFIAPRAAPTDSRFITEATSGMSRLRKTASRSRNASSTTMAMKMGSLSVSTRAKSMLVAVSPPTCTTRLVPSAARGMTRSRSAFTRLTVCSACGLVVG
jgi:hypothetical protein